MGSNAAKFRQFLQERNIVMEEGGNDVITFFAIEENLKSGPRIRIVVVFDNQDGFMNIYTYNYINVSIANPARKDYIYKLLNEINLQYSYLKFTINDDDFINASCHYPIYDNFNAQLAFDLMIEVFRGLENEYGRFMKALWT